MSQSINLPHKLGASSPTTAPQLAISAGSQTTTNQNLRPKHSYPQVQPILQPSQAQAITLKLIESPDNDLKSNRTFSASRLLEYQCFKPDEFFKKCSFDSSDSSISYLSEEDRYYSGCQNSDDKQQILLSWRSACLAMTSHQFMQQVKSQKKGYALPNTNTMTTPPKIKPFQNKRKPCNCQKNQCLKMYCDCFKLELNCQDCNCCDCHNVEEYQDQRARALATIKKRRIKNYTNQTKVCRCVKSQCRRDYCECFQSQEKCGEECQCLNCQNMPLTPNTV